MREIETSTLVYAFGLTTLAGLATGIGSAIAFFAHKTNKRFLTFSLGFSAGVMLYVSFVEILAKSRTALTAAFGPARGEWIAFGSFFAGIAAIALLDKLVPEFENPHEMKSVEDMDSRRPALMRMGIFSAIAIALHNFPEGLATFTAAIYDPAIGVSIAIAIAIHNIPEGITVAVPIYYATGSRRKAFAYSFLSGCAEPLGAVVGYFFLFRFFGESLFGILFAVVAAIMVYISLDELLPAAERYGEHHWAIAGVFLGMFIIGGSLVLLG